MRAEVDAERRVGRPDLAEDAVVDARRRAEAAVLLGDADAHHPELVEPLAHPLGELRVVVVLLRVHVLGGPRPEGAEDRVERLALLRGERRKGEDEVFADLAEEDALRERRIDVRRREMRAGRRGGHGGGGGRGLAHRIPDGIGAFAVSRLAGRGAIGAVFTTDAGNKILDADFGLIKDAQVVSAKLDAIEGVVCHGLFIGLAQMVIMADGEEIIKFEKDLNT